VVADGSGARKFGAFVRSDAWRSVVKTRIGAIINLGEM
jgi:hypothetical protein